MIGVNFLLDPKSLVYHCLHLFHLIDLHALMFSQMSFCFSYLNNLLFTGKNTKIDYFKKISFENKFIEISFYTRY